MGIFHPRTKLAKELTIETIRAVNRLPERTAKHREFFDVKWNHVIAEFGGMTRHKTPSVRFSTTEGRGRGRSGPAPAARWAFTRAGSPTTPTLRCRRSASGAMPWLAGWMMGCLFLKC